MYVYDGVSVPPTVQSSVPKGQLTTRRGGTVTLTCTASGNPMPNILWTKKVCTSSPREAYIPHLPLIQVTGQSIKRDHVAFRHCWNACSTGGLSLMGGCQCCITILNCIIYHSILLQGILGHRPAFLQTSDCLQPSLFIH